MALQDRSIWENVSSDMFSALFLLIIPQMAPSIVGTALAEQRSLHI